MGYWDLEIVSRCKIWGVCYSWTCDFARHKSKLVDFQWRSKSRIKSSCRIKEFRRRLCYNFQFWMCLWLSRMQLSRDRWQNWWWYFRQKMFQLFKGMVLFFIQDIEPNVPTTIKQSFSPGCVHYCIQCDSSFIECVIINRVKEHAALVV